MPLASVSALTPIRLVIISGVSGAGKGVALNALEDVGYYTVDNAPLALLPQLTASLAERGVTRIAAAVDARNTGTDFHALPTLIGQLRDDGTRCEVVFLDAADPVLLKRFSETRRRHPLNSDSRGLADALAQERELLAPVRDGASISIDTTDRSPHELATLMRERIDARDAHSLSLQFESFAFRHGVPPDADFVFDMRCLPNPHWVAELRPLTGRDQPVVEFFERQPALTMMLDSLTAFLRTWIPAFETDNRAYLTVAIGCTGGKHRSVYVTEKLAALFGENRRNVLMHHRELNSDKVS